MGYTTVDLVPGKQVVKGASFVTVGDDELSIQDIKMQGVDLGEGDTQIWWWNGSTYDAMAFWFSDLYADESGETTLGYAGWGDGEYWMPVNKTFAPGEAFWIKVSDTVTSASATMAGQIATTSSTEQYYGIPLTPGAQVQMTNPFPTGDLGLQSVKIEGVDLGEGDAQIWWWNGTTYDAMAFWFSDLYADESGETTLGYAGWGDGEYWMPVNKTFTEGEGFWVKVSDTVTSATLKFPNPFYVAP